jgi:hypothetical protein
MKALSICGINLVNIIRIHRQDGGCERHCRGAQCILGATWIEFEQKLVFRGCRLPREWSYGGWKRVVRVLEYCAGEKSALEVWAQQVFAGSQSINIWV